MKNSNNSFLGKTIYSLIFLVLLPAGLWLWTKNASHAIHIPGVQSAIWGFLIIVPGFLLMLFGMYALWHFGKGLPMNAYPPQIFVNNGVFRLLPHPIYTGFVLCCFGLSVFFGNAAGLWLISPMVLLGCMALVWGFENIDLRKRFPIASGKYLLSVPADTPQPATFWNRVSVYVCLLFPYFLLNSAIIWIFRHELMSQPFFKFSAIELSPTLNWTIGILALVWTFGAPLVPVTQEQLRHFFIAGIIGSLTFLYLSIMIPGSYLGLDTLWTNIIIMLSWFWVWLTLVLYEKVFPAYRLIFYSIAVLLSFGLIIISFDLIVQFLLGLISLFMAYNYSILWEYIRSATESIANSWKEWTFGAVRVINHGFYVGIGAFLGTVIGSLLAGEAYIFPIVVFGVIVTVCSGLWGQLIEGSDKLKRPFGFYGGMIGIAIASLVMHWMAVNVWVMIGVFSVFMPWVQGIGRFRCLVNGCCHGSPSDRQVGIRYTHPRSRVCFISGLKGEFIHPTPLYSMLWLFLVGGVQLRLWFYGAELSFLFGMYLMLNGLGRFVEEAYRGEPQTPIFAKLRLYQWISLVSFLTGAFFTCVEVEMPYLHHSISWQTFAWAAFNWVFVQFLMGVDFPKSQIRFSRLT